MTVDRDAFNALMSAVGMLKTAVTRTYMDSGVQASAIEKAVAEIDRADAELRATIQE